MKNTRLLIVAVSALVLTQPLNSLGDVYDDLANTAQEINRQINSAYQEMKERDRERARQQLDRELARDERRMQREFEQQDRIRAQQEELKELERQAAEQKEAERLMQQAQEEAARVKAQREAMQETRQLLAGLLGEPFVLNVTSSSPAVLRQTADLPLNPAAKPSPHDEKSEVTNLLKGLLD